MSKDIWVSFYELQILFLTVGVVYKNWIGKCVPNRAGGTSGCILPLDFDRSVSNPITTRGAYYVLRDCLLPHPNFQTFHRSCKRESRVDVTFLWNFWPLHLEFEAKFEGEGKKQSHFIMRLANIC